MIVVWIISRCYTITYLFTTTKFPNCTVPTAVTLSGLSGSSVAARWPLVVGGLVLVGLVGAAIIRRRLVPSGQQ